jgi:predicted nucleic acid-binding protein
MPVERIDTLLLDTNVWLDYFLREGQSVEAIERVIALGFEGRFTLTYAPTSAKDVFFIIPRRLRLRSEDPAASESYLPAAWACVSFMMEHAATAPQALGECELARMMRGSFPDFEDNLIVAAAQSAKASYIVTNDKKMLAAMPEFCIAPERVLELAG